MFPLSEMAARLERVRRAMAEDGIDALVVLAPDSQYWLCGLRSFISGLLSKALIVPAEGETTLVMWDADEPLARGTDDEPAQVGVVVGGTYAMTAGGIEQLAGAGPVDLVTV